MTGYRSRRPSRRSFLSTVAATGVVGKMRAAQAGKTAPLLSFGVVADAQYADQDARGTRFYRQSLQKLRACVDDFNGRDLDFVVHLGDFIDCGFENFAAPSAILNWLKAQHYHVLGNHDFSVDNALKSNVSAALGMTRRYYDFVVDAWRFVVLDGNDLSMIASVPGTDAYRVAEARCRALEASGAPNGLEWNGGLGEAQLAWLRDTLDDAAASDQRVVLCSHFPVYPAHSLNLWNDTELLKIVDAYECVALYLNGHHHAGHYAERNGVHHLTLRGMVETKDTTAYGVIEVYGDCLLLHGVGREEDRRLLFLGTPDAASI